MTHEILPCKLCKSEATMNERYRFWECSNPSCLCTGPGEDESGEKWNELMRVERSDAAVRYQVEENGDLKPVATTQSILDRLKNLEHFTDASDKFLSGGLKSQADRLVSLEQWRAELANYPGASVYLNLANQPDPVGAVCEHRGIPIPDPLSTDWLCGSCGARASRGDIANQPEPVGAVCGSRKKVSTSELTGYDIEQVVGWLMNQTSPYAEIAHDIIAEWLMKGAPSRDDFLKMKEQFAKVPTQAIGHEKGCNASPVSSDANADGVDELLCKCGILVGYAPTGWNQPKNEGP